MSSIVEDCSIQRNQAHQATRPEEAIFQILIIWKIPFGLRRYSETNDNKITLTFPVVLFEADVI